MIQLTKEAAIGNYMNIPNCSLKILSDTRQHMILLVEELVRLKCYNEETLYLAVSIADRYLVNLAVAKEKAPCLVTLSVTCLLIAAKIEEPISPSYLAMI